MRKYVVCDVTATVVRRVVHISVFSTCFFHDKLLKKYRSSDLPEERERETLFSFFFSRVSFSYSSFELSSLPGFTGSIFCAQSELRENVSRGGNQ